MMLEPQDQVAHAPFMRVELQAIEHVLWGYSQYLQRTQPSSEAMRRVRCLERLRERFAAQLTASDVQTVHLALSAEELAQLLDAMQAFAQVIGHLLPKDEQRDCVIEAINVWQLRLIFTLAGIEI